MHLERIGAREFPKVAPRLSLSAVQCLAATVERIHTTIARILSAYSPKGASHQTKRAGKTGLLYSLPRMHAHAHPPRMRLFRRS